MKKLDLLFLAIVAAATVILATSWMVYVDVFGPGFCGLGWDFTAGGVRSCGLAAIGRELITVDGAIAGLWSALTLILERRKLER